MTFKKGPKATGKTLRPAWFCQVRATMRVVGTDVKVEYTGKSLPSQYGVTRWRDAAGAIVDLVVAWVRLNAARLPRLDGR